MKTMIPAIMSVLIISSVLSCRNDLADLHHGTGDLTVSVSVDKSLYLGEYIQDQSGRFVGPSSNTLSLTYITGGNEFHASAELTLSGSGPSYTGTAVLRGLPVGVEGTVLVQTLDDKGILLCEGSETMTLDTGVNETSIILKVSGKSPYLSLAGPAEYLDEVLLPKETQFVKVTGLQSGMLYQMLVHQDVETQTGPVISVITEDGADISFKELDTVNGGISFTVPSGQTSVVVCFYNPNSFEIPGLLWFDKPTGYTSLVYGGYYNEYYSMGYGENYRMTAAQNKLFLTSQELTSTGYNQDGLWVSTDKGTSWTNDIPIADNFIAGNSLGAGASVTDLVYSNGIIYAALYHDTTTVSPTGEIGTAAYNPLTGTVTQIFDPWASDLTVAYSGPFEHLKIAKSATHTFLAYLDTQYTETLRLMARTDGSTITTEVSMAGFTTSTSTYNELQLCAIDDTVYILGDQVVYSWKAGAGSLKPILTMAGNVPEIPRYMTLFKDKYVIASNGKYSYLYLPDTGSTFTLSDYNEMQNELPDSLLQDLYTGETGSENYIMVLNDITDEGGFTPQAMSLSVYANGGLNLAGTAAIPAADLPYAQFQPVQIIMDEANSIVYLGGIDASDGYSYFWYYFTLQ